MTNQAKASNPLAAADTWLYHLGEIDAPRAAEIARSGADLVVMDYADDDQAPYSHAEVAAVRGTDETLVLSYLSIGEAEAYRAYWTWGDETPPFVAAANPEWQDNYKVAYWDAQWRNIVFDYVDEIVDAGFDGLYLDVLDAFDFWEREAPKPDDVYRDEMVRLVADIRTHAQARLDAAGEDRDFVLIGQNAEELARDPTYLAAVDGIAKEDLVFTYEAGSPEGFRPVPEEWFRDSLGHLRHAEAAGVEVFVVEYVPPSAAGGAAADLAREADLLRGLDIPLYVARERNLLDIYDIGERDAGLLLHGIGRADILHGGTGPDRLFGKGGHDTLEGRAGGDRLDGGPGADVLNGGAGHDGLLGRSGADRMLGGVGGDDLRGGQGNDVMLAGPGADVLAGAQGADRLFGGAGNDSLKGGMGPDTLVGGQGADILVGGAGRDVLVGGAGADGFVHGGRAADGSDVVRDYAASQGDVLFLHGPGIASEDIAAIRSAEPGLGDPALAQALVIDLPSGRVLWTIIDGAADIDTAISVSLPDTSFDLFV